MSKEKRKNNELGFISSREVRDHLPVITIVSIASIYILGMLSKLNHISGIMGSGYQYFADPSKSLLEIFQQLDFTHIPGGAYTIEELHSFQFMFAVALFIILTSALAYGMRSYKKRQAMFESGSKLVAESPGNVTSNYESAINNIEDKLEPNDVEDDKTTTVSYAQSEK